MDGTRNMRSRANQFRKMSVLAPGDISICRQRCFRVHTNRGRENIVLLYTAPHGPRGRKGDNNVCGHPTNLLGKQNQATLEKAGLPAVAVSKENASVRTCSVRESVQIAIETRRISAAMLHPRAVASSCCSAAPSRSSLQTAVTVLLDAAILHVLMSLNPTLGLIKDFGNHRRQFCQPLPRQLESFPSVCLHIDLLYNTSHDAIFLSCINTKTLANEASGWF